MLSAGKPSVALTADQTSSTLTISRTRVACLSSKALCVLLPRLPSHATRLAPLDDGSSLATDSATLGDFGDATIVAKRVVKHAREVKRERRTYVSRSERQQLCPSGEIVPRIVWREVRDVDRVEPLRVSCRLAGLSFGLLA